MIFARLNFGKLIVAALAACYADFLFRKVCSRQGILCRKGEYLDVLHVSGRRRSFTLKSLSKLELTMVTTVSPVEGFTEAAASRNLFFRL